MDSENHNHLSKHEDRCPDHSHAAVRTLGKRR